MHGSQRVRSCHATLRGDALWLGEKWNTGDEVIALCSTTTLATDGMLLISSQDGKVVARLFPEESTVNAWAAKLQEAGKLVGAVNRRESLEREARRLAQKQHARKLATKLTTAVYKLGGSMRSSQLSATEVLMDWQRQSEAATRKTSQEPRRDLHGDSLLIFRRKYQTQPEMRKVKLCGDVLFVSHQDGESEEPLLLTGATVYVHGSTVSVWSDEVLRVRVFFDTPEAAQSLGEPLLRAASLIANVKTGKLAAIAKPPSRSPSTSKLADEETSSPRQADKFGRARRYETPLKQRPKDKEVEDKLLGA